MRISGMNIQNNFGCGRLPNVEVSFVDVDYVDIGNMQIAYGMGSPCRLISWDRRTNRCHMQTDESELKIERVIFNDPATIVFWNDGTKTVVKCDNKDRFSEEMGLAMACTKKLLGNNYTYYGKFEKALDKATRTLN